MPTRTVLGEISKEPGLGNGDIYQLWNREKVMLDTINRIADVLGCKACDLLEEAEVEVKIAQQ